MADHRVDQLIRGPGGGQQFRGLFAVFLGPLFKVDVVEQAHRGPEVLVALPQLPGQNAHYGLHGKGVLKVEGFGIILPQQGQSRLPVHASVHGICLLENFVLSYRAAGEKSRRRTDSRILRVTPGLWASILSLGSVEQQGGI